jgi:hypothetical protein
MDEHERDILREAGRRFAALRQVVTSRCEICGDEITGTLKRRYCSNKCRVKASRQRRQGEPAGAINHDVVAEPMPAVSSTVERLAAIRERLAGAGGGDAAEDIRRSREERTAALAGPVPAAS